MCNPFHHSGVFACGWRAKCKAPMYSTHSEASDQKSYGHIWISKTREAASAPKTRHGHGDKSGRRRLSVGQMPREKHPESLWATASLTIRPSCNFGPLVDEIKDPRSQVPGRVAGFLRVSWVIVVPSAKREIAEITPSEATQ